jgi:hypothetical protein
MGGERCEKTLDLEEWIYATANKNNSALRERSSGDSLCQGNEGAKQQGFGKQVEGVEGFSNNRQN